MSIAKFVWSETPRTNRNFTMVSSKSTLIFYAVSLYIASAANAIDLTKSPGVVADTGSVGFVFSAAKSLAVNERLTIAHDVSSVCSFVIADGPDAVDVIFQAGMAEAGGACGFSKSGAGTLRVEGDVLLGGVITIYDGTLDLSAARLKEGARINLMGDAKMISPTTSRNAIDLYRNGEKLDGKSRHDEIAELIDLPKGKRF